MTFPTVRIGPSQFGWQCTRPKKVMELSRASDGTFWYIPRYQIGISGLGGAEMGEREKLTFVYDADGSIGVVMEFSESDFEAYSMPDFALVGTFQTKVQAAQALATRTHQFRH